MNGKLSYSASRRRLPVKSKKLTDAIVAFLERGDNSRVMPGKDDFVNCNGEKVQKHYLNDYIHNLHAKFRTENPDIRVGKQPLPREGRNISYPHRLARAVRVCASYPLWKISATVQAEWGQCVDD